jgi:1-deoxyxylulose-5-phosphate synthase
MHAWQFCKALYLADRHGWTRFVSMQNHYNLLYREEEREMMGLCAAEQIGVIPWSPLARGRLTRPWNQKDSTERAATDEFGKKLYAQTEEADRVVVERVGDVAGERGLPLAQVALAWVLGKPFVTSPIIGATRPNHLDDAVAALSVKLTPQEVARLEEPYLPHPVIEYL